MLNKLKKIILIIIAVAFIVPIVLLIVWACMNGNGMIPENSFYKIDLVDIAELIVNILVGVGIVSAVALFYEIEEKVRKNNDLLCSFLDVISSNFDRELPRIINDMENNADKFWMNGLNIQMDSQTRIKAIKKTKGLNKKFIPIIDNIEVYICEYFVFFADKLNPNTKNSEKIFIEECRLRNKVSIELYRLKSQIY